MFTTIRLNLVLSWNQRNGNIVVHGILLVIILFWK